MALQTLRRPISYPGIGQANNSSIGLSGTASITAGGSYSFVFQAKEAMSISHVAARFNAVVGSPSVDIRIEVIDLATGLANGLWGTTNGGAGAATNVVVSPTTTMAVHALTNTAIILAGDIVVVRLAHNGGTSFTVGTFLGSAVGACAFPYVINGTTKGGSDNFSLCLALGSSSTSFYDVEGLIPAVLASGGVTTSVSNATQDAIGIRAKLPFKARLHGHISVFGGAGYGPYEFGVYDDSNTEQNNSRTASRPAALMGAQSNGRHMYHWLDNKVIIQPDTWFRYLLWPTSSTAFIIGAYGALNADLKAVQPGGTNWHYVKKAVGGAWTDNLTTDAFLINLLVEQLDDGVSAGGTHFSFGA